MVAADGLRSGQRAARFRSGAPRYTGHVAWRGTVATDRLPAGLFPDAACVTIGPGRHLVTYPLRAGRLVNFVAVERRAAWAPEDWSQSDDRAVLRRAFYGWNPAVTTLLAAVEETWLWGLFDHPPLPDWVDGRVALLGDACHPTLPFLAQGAAMALEDAWVLAAELDAAADLDQGLRAYVARRRPRTSRVQASVGADWPALSSRGAGASAGSAAGPAGGGYGRAGPAARRVRLAVRGGRDGSGVELDQDRHGIGGLVAAKQLRTDQPDRALRAERRPSSTPSSRPVSFPRHEPIGTMLHPLCRPKNSAVASPLINLWR